MFAARFLVSVPVLCIAGMSVAKGVCRPIAFLIRSLARSRRAAMGRGRLISLSPANDGSRCYLAIGVNIGYGRKSHPSVRVADDGFPRPSGPKATDTFV